MTGTYKCLAQRLTREKKEEAARNADLGAGAYTRPLFCSTWAVSDA